MTIMTAENCARIEKFVAALQAKMELEGPGFEEGGLHWRKFSIMYGPKFARIVEERRGGNGRAVYCFVDIENGDILKSAGWKAPAKGARGTVNTPTFGVEFCDRYGSSLYKKR